MSKIIVAVLFLLPQVGWAKKFDYPAFEFAKIVEMSQPKCKKDVQYLTGGMEAPCTGYLFSPEKEYEIRLNNESHKQLKLYVEKQNELIDVMNRRIGNLKEYNNGLNNELQKRDNMNFWKSSLYFVLGVVVTGAIAANVDR